MDRMHHQLVDRPFVDRVARHIDVHGIETVEAEVAAVAVAAHQAGVNSVIVEVLADVDVPAPVRERAYGWIATRLLRTGMVHAVEQADQRVLADR